MWSNHPELIRNCPVGLHHSEVRCGSTQNCLLLPASQWFEEVWRGRTTPNSLETAFFLKQQSGSRRVGVVEPPRTHSKVPCRPLQHSGSRRFGVVEPPRTHWSTGKFRVSSGWFNHTEPPRTTLLLALQGSFE